MLHYRIVNTSAVGRSRDRFCGCEEYMTTPTNSISSTLLTLNRHAPSLSLPTALPQWEIMSPISALLFKLMAAKNIFGNGLRPTRTFERHKVVLLLRYSWRLFIEQIWQALNVFGTYSGVKLCHSRKISKYQLIGKVLKTVSAFNSLNSPDTYRSFFQPSATELFRSPLPDHETLCSHRTSRRRRR